MHAPRFGYSSAAMRERVSILGSMLPEAGLLACLLFWWFMYLSRDLATGIGQDFTTMYVGALSWLRGENPYVLDKVPAAIARHLHIAQQGVVNSPLLLPLDAPLTLLPPRVAYLTFVAVQFLLSLLAALLLANAYGIRRRRLFVLAILATPAMFLVGYYGQIGTLVFFFFSLTLWARARGYLGLAGLALACTMIKPQLGLCLTIPLLWGAPRRMIVATGIGLVGIVVVMMLILSPSQVLEYLHVLRSFDGSAFAVHNDDGLGLNSLYQGWLAPGLSTRITAACAVPILALIAFLVRRYRWTPTETIRVVLIYCIVLLLPYSHQYDAIALLPCFLVASPGRTDRFIRALYYLGVTIIVLTPLSAITMTSIPFRLYPLGLLICSLALLIREVPRRAA